MNKARWQIARDIAATTIVAVYALPLLWWGLSSILPNDVLLEPSRLFAGDFSFTFMNFAITFIGDEGGVFNSRQSVINSLIVGLGSTALVLCVALPMAYALSFFPPRGARYLLGAVVAQRLLPPIVLVFPLLVAYHTTGLLDTRSGVALAHAAINLPFAVLVLKSFCDDVPREVTEAACLDGATRWQTFTRIVVPVIKGGIAATAVLAFAFSWTEFMLSLFLTQNLRLVPVQAGILVMNMWGLISALTTAALIPAFVVILLVQRHVVRGLTLGHYK